MHASVLERLRPSFLIRYSGWGLIYTVRNEKPRGATKRLPSRFSGPVVQYAGIKEAIQEIERRAPGEEPSVGPRLVFPTSNRAARTNGCFDSSAIGASLGGE